MPPLGSGHVSDLQIAIEYLRSQGKQYAVHFGWATAQQDALRFFMAKLEQAWQQEQA